MKKQGIYIIIIIVAAVFLTLGLSFLNTSTDTGPGEYDELATCLKDKGVIFYGAFWCQHCAAQKKAFGASAKLLPYVECSTPDSRDQTEVCKTAGIESYPTWGFPDGTRVTGGLTPQELAEKTGCSLSGAATSTAADTSALSATSSATK